MFHDLSEELRLTAVMAAMEDATVTHQANNQSIDFQREIRQEKRRSETGTWIGERTG